MKLDPVVKKENLYMILGNAVCTVIVQLVFLIIGQYDYTVFFGGLWGFFITTLNFFIMSIAVQRAVSLGDENMAKLKIQASYTKRMLLLVALMVVGIVAPCFHWVPVLISVFYPRIIITVRGVITSIRQKDAVPSGSSGTSAPADAEEESEEAEQEDEFEKFVGFFGKKAASRMENANSAFAKNDGASKNANDADAEHEKESK